MGKAITKNKKKNQAGTGDPQGDVLGPLLSQEYTKVLSTIPGEFCEERGVEVAPVVPRLFKM
jgi:hypothetical protein